MSRYAKPSDKAAKDRVAHVQIGSLADDDALVLITYLDYRDEIQTVNGASDAIAANLLIITGSHAGEYEDDRLIFNKAIVGKFEDAQRGDEMLGRVSWGRSRASGRRYATLTDPLDGDEALADKAMAALKKRMKDAEPPF